MSQLILAALRVLPQATFSYSFHFGIPGDYQQPSQLLAALGPLRSHITFITHSVHYPPPKLCIQKHLPKFQITQKIMSDKAL